MPVILDSDDFYEGHTSIEVLSDLRSAIRDFKVTLFTIVGRCSASFIKDVQRIEWIDMVPHGWMHNTSYECLSWSDKDMEAYLKRISPLCLTKGFKAPGWQISDGCYKVLRDSGYWVADQPYNNNRRPKELKVYLLDSPDKIHTHIGGRMSNRLERTIQRILERKHERFEFVKDSV